jgi:DNA-binding transcriptional MerR regulator
MRISELSERSGIPVATLKFYIREGMLPRGEATSATSAEYDEHHLVRLRVIAALAGVRGLPLARVRDILELIDEPLDDARETIGRAVDALPPYDDVSDLATPGDDGHARAAIEAMGLTYDPRFAAVHQLEIAIRAVQDAGLPWDEPTLRRYAEPMRDVGLAEVVPIARISRDDVTAYAVLGTALYEPVMLALRRLVHQHLLITGQVPAPGSASSANDPAFLAPVSTTVADDDEGPPPASVSITAAEDAPPVGPVSLTATDPTAAADSGLPASAPFDGGASGVQRPTALA